MIPLAHIQQWTALAPWPELRQVEQDLIICRAKWDLFNHPQLRGKIAFRGGTAIKKLLFNKPLRYSEDIDLVQTQAEPIGGIIDGVRGALSWLGKRKWTRQLNFFPGKFVFGTRGFGVFSARCQVEVIRKEPGQLYLGFK